MNFDEAIKQLQAAQGDPDQLALATIDIVLAGREPGLRAALEAAAIPHWFDEAILAGLIGAEEARRWLEPLTALSMVEAFPLRQGWNVHEASRLALRRHLAATAPDRLRALSGLAADCFVGKEPAQRIERLFHRLVAGPDAEAAEELRELYGDWENEGRHENLQALAGVLDETRRDAPLGKSSRAGVLKLLVLIRWDNLPLPVREDYALAALKLALGLDDGLACFEAHWTLGMVLLARSKRAEAAGQFLAMAGIAQARLAQDADNNDWLRRLSMSYNLNGDLRAAQGDHAGALEHYQAAHAIAERLVDLDPANVLWQRDLSFSHERIGDLLAKQGDRAGVPEHHQAAHAITERLVGLDSANAQWQRDLAVSHGRVGDLLAIQGDRAGALERYQIGLAIAERLADLDPANAQWQRDLAVYHNRIGELLAPQGDRAGALEHYQAGLAIAERLASLDQANTEWQRDLAVSHWKLAGNAEQAGEPAGALAHYRVSVAIMAKLAALDPGHAQWRDDLAWCGEQIRRLEG